MNKLTALMSLLVSVVPAFALNGMSIPEAVSNVQRMASVSMPNQTGNVEPAIASLIDAYHAQKPFASFLAETELTFANGQKVTLGEYLENYAENNLEEFAAFNKEIKNFEGDANMVGQFVLFNMADPMKKLEKNEEATTLAKKYVKYTVNGQPLVQFAKEPGVCWAQSALDELATFGERVEHLTK